MELKLKRIISDSRHTAGVLIIDKVQRFATLELPWRQNKPLKSCIPVGKYKWVKEFSPHFGYRCCELKGVPGRSEVKIHIANRVSELQGCIAIGMYFSFRAINELENSRIAFEEFMSIMPESGTIEIVDAL